MRRRCARAIVINAAPQRFAANAKAPQPFFILLIFYLWFAATAPQVEYCVWIHLMSSLLRSERKIKSARKCWLCCGSHFIESCVCYGTIFTNFYRSLILSWPLSRSPNKMEILHKNASRFSSHFDCIYSLRCK